MTPPYALVKHQFVDLLSKADKHIKFYQEIVSDWNGCRSPAFGRDSGVFGAFRGICFAARGRSQRERRHAEPFLSRPIGRWTLRYDISPREAGQRKKKNCHS